MPHFPDSPGYPEQQPNPPVGPWQAPSPWTTSGNPFAPPALPPRDPMKPSRRGLLVAGGLVVVLLLIAGTFTGGQLVSGLASGAPGRPTKPVKLRPYDAKGPLAGVSIKTDGSTEAAAAVQALTSFPEPVLDLAVDQAEDSGLSVRFAVGDLDQLVPADAAENALGVYAAGEFLAATPDNGLWAREDGDRSYDDVAGEVTPPPAAVRLQLQTVALHEWGHLIDDALADEAWYEPVAMRSESAEFRRLCTSLPHEVLDGIRETWDTKDEQEICGEVFAEGAARLATAPRTVEVDGTSYRVPGPFDWVPDQARERTEQQLDAYFAGVVATLSR